MEVDGGIQVGVGGDSKVEVERIDSQTAKFKFMIFAKVQKAGLRIGFFGLRSKVRILL